MTRAEWKRVYRFKRMIRRVAHEQFMDTMLFGNSAVRYDDTGFGVVAPSEILPTEMIAPGVKIESRRWMTWNP